MKKMMVTHSLVSVQFEGSHNAKSHTIRLYSYIWYLVEYIEKYATIEQYQKLALSLYTNEGI